MKKIHKIIMGALLGGIAVSNSHGYGNVSVQAVDSHRYKDETVLLAQNSSNTNAKPTATPAAKPTAKATATPEPKITGKITSTPQPKITGKITATPEPKVSGKVTATPEPKVSGKITVTPEPKISAKVSAKANPTPAPKNSGAFAVAQTAISRIFSFFSAWFK